MENCSNVFIIAVNENLHSKIWSPFYPSSWGYTASITEGCILLMPIPETDYQWPRRNTYISEIWVLIKTHSQKLKLVTLVSSFVKSLGFTNRKISYNHKLFSFLGGNIYPLSFWKKDRIPTPMEKQQWLIRITKFYRERR